MERTSALLLILSFTAAAKAQPGTLDASFSDDGIVQIDLVPSGESGQDALPTADGRLYVCGYLNSGSQDNGFVLRLLPDGTPDATFGTVVLPSGNGGRAFRMAYAADSSLYICGFADTLGYEAFTLWHVLTTGAMDASFGYGGRSSVQIGFNDARARHLAVQTDGHIVLVGYESAGFGRDGVLVRFSPDGTLDTSFSGDGILVLDSYSQLDQLDAVALMEDGSIIGGGYARVNNYDRALIIKVSASGSLAFGFGTQGLLTPDLSANNSRIYSVAVSGTQVIAAGALLTTSTSSDVFITRRNANGAADITFGTIGVAEIDVMDDDQLDDMELLPDGRIVVTGYTGSTAPGGDVDFLLACYLTNGQPDAGFGNAGIVITETSPSYEGGYGVCVQPDGKLVVTGFGGVIGNTALVVLRYANDLSTTVADGPASEDLLLYPNPAADHVSVQLTGNAAATIELIDANGRSVGTWNSAGDRLAQLPLHRFRSGHYVVRVTQDGLVKRRTLEILR